MEWGRPSGRRVEKKGILKCGAQLCLKNIGQK
jgi:hypothetical protein